MVELYHFRLTIHGLHVFVDHSAYIDLKQGISRYRAVDPVVSENAVPSPSDLKPQVGTELTAALRKMVSSQAERSGSETRTR